MQTEAITHEAFHAALRRESSLRNAGVTTRYDAKADKTDWLIADAVVGRSTGPLGSRIAYSLLVSPER